MTDPEQPPPTTPEPHPEPRSHHFAPVGLMHDARARARELRRTRRTVAPRKPAPEAPAKP